MSEIDVDIWALRSSAAALLDGANILAHLSGQIDTAVDLIEESIEGETGNALREFIQSISPRLSNGSQAWNQAASSLEQLAWELQPLAQTSVILAQELRRAEQNPDLLGGIGEYERLTSDLRLQTSRAGAVRHAAADEIHSAALRAVKAGREAYEHSLRGRLTGFFKGTWHGIQGGFGAIFRGTVQIVAGAWDAVYGFGRLVLWDLSSQIISDPSKWAKNWQNSLYGVYRIGEAVMLSSPSGALLMLKNERLRKRTLESYSAVLDVETLKKNPARWVGKLGGEILLAKGMGKAGAAIKSSSRLAGTGELIERFGLSKRAARLAADLPGGWLPHTFEGDFSRGLKGLHHVGPGELPEDVRLSGISAPDVHGITRATVSKLDPALGSWITKKGFHTMFPNAWSRSEAVIQIHSAFSNAEFTGLKWRGTSSSGVEMRGWIDSQGRLDAVFPVYSP